MKKNEYMLALGQFNTIRQSQVFYKLYPELILQERYNSAPSEVAMLYSLYTITLHVQHLN